MLRLVATDLEPLPTLSCPPPEGDLLEHLGADAAGLAADGLAPATRDAYASDWRAWARWCDAQGWPPDRAGGNLTPCVGEGVSLDQCVMATMTDAACLGYDCVLLEDCAATTRPRTAGTPRSTTSESASALSPGALISSPA